MSRISLSFILGCFLGCAIVFSLYNTVLIERTIVSSLPDGGEYTGERKGELLHGSGVLKWPEGSFYKGEFQDGVIEGQGLLHASDGSIYEGEFKTGMLHGKGTFQLNGMIYSGEFKNNWFHGNGEHTLPNGSHYLGEFKEGNYHGHGEYSMPNGDRYVGEFKEGYYHGVGDFLTKEQGRYTGEFVEGEFTGHGIYEYPDGSAFEGEFKSWALGGDGVLTYENGDKQIGDFSDGVLNGDGEFTAVDGRHYKGSFQYGLYHGQGEFAGEEGSYYIGGFDNGSYHGDGELTLANGDHYIGQFEYGNYHGKGTLTYAEPQDGTKVVVGKWKYGKLDSCEKGCSVISEAKIAEAALYNQQQLLDTQLGALQSHNSDQIDMYFLGVAGYGSQAVFRREVLFAKDYFDSNFNTQGASITLINDRSTIYDYPLATTTSIQRALQNIAGNMDVDEDILFVFLASHGSKNHSISIDQPGLELDDISAEKLAEMLEKLPVKWKVIVVSACYSGGYIPHLQDEHTMVITASASDKKSFGCSDRNQFTYFGEAFFKDALPESSSFVEAFDKAKVIVAEREIKKDYPQSEPQISQSKKILEKLKSWRVGLIGKNENVLVDTIKD